MELVWIAFDDLLAAVLAGTVQDAPLVQRRAAGPGARPGLSVASAPA